MLAIPLPNDEHTCVDETHFDELAKYNWCICSTGYVVATINRKGVLMTRMIMKPSKGKVVNHINGNKLINTESNLRICTYSENNYNIGLRADNSSGHKGVSWYKKENKWRVTITKDGKQYRIGCFDNLEDAIEASKKARLEYHGEYACFEREEIDMTEFYMAKWHPKSVELFAKAQEPKSSGILNLTDLTVAIPTTQDQVAIIELFDYNLVSQYKWYANHSAAGYYALTNIPKNGKQVHIQMHRLIKDAKKGDVVDHKNGSTMDNRNCNLRITDHSGNMRNRGLISSNTSGVSGVIFHKIPRLWRATYSKNGKQITIGYYKTKEEAITARLAVVAVEYGEFLRTT